MRLVQRGARLVLLDTPLALLALTPVVGAAGLVALAQRPLGWLGALACWGLAAFMLGQPRTRLTLDGARGEATLERWRGLGPARVMALPFAEVWDVSLRCSAGARGDETYHLALCLKSGEELTLEGSPSPEQVGRRQLADRVNAVLNGGAHDPALPHV